MTSLLLFCLLIVLLVQCQCISSISSIGSPDCISGTFKVETPFGKKIPGFRLRNTFDGYSAITDADGVAEIPCLKSGMFNIFGKAPEPKYQDMIILGSASSAFNYTTYFGTRVEAQAVFKTLGIEFDAEKGIVVVGLDVSRDGSNQPSSLDPAIGSSSQMEYINTDVKPQPFIYENGLPTFGQTIDDNSQSFVTYPNVLVGKKITMKALPATGQKCLLSPGLPPQDEPLVVDVTPDTVTVISYICSAK